MPWLSLLDQKISMEKICIDAAGEIEKNQIACPSFVVLKLNCNFWIITLEKGALDMLERGKNWAFMKHQTFSQLFLRDSRYQLLKRWLFSYSVFIYLYTVLTFETLVYVGRKIRENKQMHKFSWNAGHDSFYDKNRRCSSALYALRCYSSLGYSQRIFLGSLHFLCQRFERQLVQNRWFRGKN